MNKVALLVEDTVLHRKLYSIWLELIGYTVHVVPDDRVAVFEATRVRPAIAVIDIMLSSLDGRDIIRRLRRNPETAQVPIVALSVLSSVDDEETCYAAGANTFHQKLKGRTDFVNCIRGLE